MAHVVACSPERTHCSTKYDAWGLHLEQRTAAAERIAQGERRWRKFYGRLAAGFAILLVAAAVAVGVSLKHDPNPRHNFEYRQ